MSNDYRTAPIEDVIQAAKKAAVCIYIGADRVVADDIAGIITRLVEELRDARRDTARLDWLDKDRGLRLGLSDSDPLEEPNWVVDNRAYGFIRNAIDHAMEEG